MSRISSRWKGALAVCACLASGAAFVGCGLGEDETEDELGAVSQAATVSPAVCRLFRDFCDRGALAYCRYVTRYRCDSGVQPDPGAQPNVRQCTDTDGGRRPFVRGTVTDSRGRTFTDDCIDSGAYVGYVREHYCTSTGGHNMHSIKCAYGCQQGRCR